MPLELCGKGPVFVLLIPVGYIGVACGAVVVQAVLISGVDEAKFSQHSRCGGVSDDYGLAAAVCFNFQD